MQVVRVHLRKLNGRLRIALPDEVIESFKLTAYDSVDLIKESDSVRLRFVKVPTPWEMARAAEPAA
jgi:hypothetical protein